MTLVVHQTLHGYSDGHRLIAGSLSLSSAEARIMVVMSDLSGPGVKADASGYLTGYPLEGAGKYVLARTWAAPEMPRPGCVWTHSLIVDNADLAAMTSAADLMAAFRRPSGPIERSEYSRQVEIDIGRGRAQQVRSQRARGLLTALYAAPDRNVVAEVDQPDEDELLVTAIWMQQWPRLRRSFGFCTLAGMDRSGKGAALDLQLVRAPDRQARSKFPNSVTPEEMVTEPALEQLVSDLSGRDDTQIRDFLRRTGGDVDGGRRAMLPLCRLHASLFSGGGADLSAAVAALGALDSLGRRQARSVRMLIARSAIDKVDDVDDDVFDFVVDTLELGLRPNEEPAAADRIGAALWRRSPMRFQEAINTGGAIGAASFHALPSLSTDDLLSGVRDHPSLAPWIGRARPELLERSDFWEIAGIDDSIAADIDGVDTALVAAALLAAGRYGPAHKMIAQADVEGLAAALAGRAPDAVLNAWLKALVANPDKAAGVLASGKISYRSAICSMARFAAPDALPNDYGEDPWLIALRSAPKPLGQVDEDFLAAFTMTRALGTRSRSQAQLMRFAYTTLYRAFQNDRLPADVNLMATSRLDWGGWLTWDNCSRLRETVVRRFVDRSLDPETFGRLSDDGPLSLALIDEAARTGSGRRFLGEVRKRLKNAAEKGIRVRADYIARKIK